MAKDRNTMAKRQREMEKKRKAEEKKEKRIRRRAETNAAANGVASGDSATGDAASTPSEPEELKRTVSSKSRNATPARQLSDGEAKVLDVFRKYLMTPGQMLCLGNADIDSMKAILENLTSRGLLVAEGFKGGYSLTPSGFDAMKRLG